MLSVVVFGLFFAQAFGGPGESLLQSRQWTGPPLPPDNHSGAKIINGVDAQDNQFPYMVSLNWQGDGHACGASIVSPSWVLTAAHCCLTGTAMYIYAGSVVLSSGGETYDISQYIIHGDYKPDEGWRNDVCLVKINGAFQFSDRIQQVTLPPQDWPVNSGDNLLISGWGYTNPNDGQQFIPDRMQVGYNFKAYSNEECGSRTGVNMVDGYLCVQGGSGQGVCGGDSGSPLMKDGVQVGIASWVFLPCGSGAPDFYSRVPKYINWIQQVLGAEAKDLKFIQS